MSEPNSNELDAEGEYIVNLMVHGIQAGYSPEDERFKQLYATAMVLETLANTAIDKTEPLFESRRYEQAIQELTYVIDDGERYFAQHPKSLAEAAYGYTLARLYSVRAAARFGASSQSHDATLLQHALKDADKALSYPATHYEFIDLNLLERVRSLRDTIQAALTEYYSSEKLLKHSLQLAQQVSNLQTKLVAEEEAARYTDAIFTASSGISMIEDFFSKNVVALAHKPQLEALVGTELAKLYAMRAVQYTHLNLWKEADKDVTKALSFPASYYQDPAFEAQLRELQTEIKREKGGCFIATSVYGSPLAPEIVVLQRFREDRLRPHRYGRWLISIYERYSPHLADAIALRPTARLWVRRLLLAPVISAIQHWFP